MKNYNDRIMACEVGDISGKPVERAKPRRCKFKNCNTTLHSYHKGKYCYIHESKAFMKSMEKTPYLSANTFHIHS